VLESYIIVRTYSQTFPCGHLY